MTKLVIDTSSVLSAYMHLEDKEFGIDIEHEGKPIHIPDLQTCMERAQYSMNHTLDDLGLRYTDCIFVLDQQGTGQQRKIWFSDYKASRGSKPKEYYNVYNKFVEDFVEWAMRKGAISCVAKVTPAVECDDLIDEICKRFPDVIVYTRDKDLLSCPAKHHLIDKELDPIKYPVPRDLIKLYRTLVTGDSSDNIPSCKGFGEKAWDGLKDLIGWEGLYELDKMVNEKRLHELQEDVSSYKKLQLLIDQADDIYLSYKLHTFIHVPAHKVKWSARVTDCSQTLVTADNFDQCFDEVVEELKGATHCVIDYETDTDPESDEWLKGTFDPETGKQAVKVDVIGSYPTGMGLKVSDKCWYFSHEHYDTNNISFDQFKKVITLLEDKKVYAHNSTSFESVVTYNTFNTFMEEIVDTRIQSSYIDENDAQGLKHLSKKHLGYQQETYEQTLAKAQAARPDRVVRGMRDVTGEEVLGYGLDDTITCDSLQNLFECIMQYEGTLQVFYDVEQKSALVTSIAFIKGVPFNAEAHKELKEENDKNIEETYAKVKATLLEIGWGRTIFKPFALLNGKTVKDFYELVTGTKLDTKARSAANVLDVVDDPFVVEVCMQGLDAINEEAEKRWKPEVEFNVNSPVQMKRLMYEVLGCEKRVTNKPTDKNIAAGIYEGSAATNESAMKNALAFHDTHEVGLQLIKDILDLKKYMTRESLFLRKYPPLVHWKTGNLHCSMSQCGTSTRRFTHSAPNLAQNPKRKGKEVRNMEKAPEGWSLVSFDIDSNELKLQAWDCQCPAFLACYTGPKEQRKDVHATTGFQVNLKAETKLTDSEIAFIEMYKDGSKEATEFRAKGKTVNFATAYLCKPRKLSWEMCCTFEEAVAFMEAKDAAFPGLSPYVEKWNDLCMDRGYSTTFLGARRHLHQKIAIARSQGEIDSIRRLMWSFRIQGSGIEQLKLAMGRLVTEGVIDINTCVCLMQIHDELVMCIRDDVLEQKIADVHRCVTMKYADMDLDVGSTPAVGKTFGALKDYELTGE